MKYSNYFNSNPIPNSMKKLPVNVYTAQRKLSELYVASEKKPNSLTGEELLHTFKVDAYPKAVIEAVTLSGLAPILRHQEENVDNPEAKESLTPYFLGTYSQISINKSKLKSYFGI